MLPYVHSSSRSDALRCLHPCLISHLSSSLAGLLISPRSLSGIWRHGQARKHGHLDGEDHARKRERQSEGEHEPCNRSNDNDRVHGFSYICEGTPLSIARP